MISSFDQLFLQILEETNQDYIKEYSLDLKKFLKLSKDSLKSSITNNNYSSLTMVNFFMPFLKNYKDIDNKSWLKIIYNYTLSLSFSHKVNPVDINKLEPLICFYLKTIKLISKSPLPSHSRDFLNNFSVQLLDKNEYKSSDLEYLRFLKTYDDLYIYELMFMDLDLTGHNTLEHLLGVNNLSIYIARQLRNYGLPVNLGTVVGTSLAHDIGKYGVLNIDKNKVPYYHYYYTEDWYKKNNMPTMGHIASNHSTWDLELENLSLESLVLIYCDFRVKNRLENDSYKMNIFSLKDSYSIILNKLDNLDSLKEQRYEKVYKKLKDFEDYMHSININTNLDEIETQTRKKHYDVFMNSHEIVSSYKFLAIENNIHLMSKLLDNNEFNRILEKIRSEYNWRRLRVYLQIFTEYSTYITKEQKLLLINFLLELLFHKEDDIRKESAILIGVLISDYDEDLRKEIPPSVNLDPSTSHSSSLVLEDTLNKILYPDYKYANSNIDWQYNLKSLIKSIFINANPKNSKDYVKVLIKFYNDSDNLDEKSQVYLAQTSKYIPYHILSSKERDAIYSYIKSLIYSNFIELQLTILDIIDEIFDEDLNDKVFKDILTKWLLEDAYSNNHSSLVYLKHKIALKLNLPVEKINSFKNNYDSIKTSRSNIFLNNLKTATDWMDKKVNIDILYDQVALNPKEFGLHTGMHFCNLLKVSAVEKVRNYAGHTLINIFPYLSIEEKNDIVVELLRALEMQNYQFTKYIPKYLGRAILRLEKSELNEIIDDLEVKIKTSNIQTSFLILQLAGYSIEYFNEYKEEDKSLYKETLNRLIGLLLIGMASYKEDVKMEALRILSSNIFNSYKLSLEGKYYIFNIIAKKLLTLLPPSSEEDFSLLNKASSFNNIYRFIIDYEFKYSSLELDSKTKYAFFPGSFDPFTSGHKEIVKTIRNLGFEVYLAIDEFSWSKRTQPHHFRKDLINISLANEKDIFIFPGDIPINISNDKDLDKLSSLFDTNPYIVIGVDVLLNASAYSYGNKITNFPHIIIDREDDNIDLLEDKLSLLTKETLFLDIDKSYRDISSTKIRNRIDMERDISDKIDPLAEDYIYEHGLYIRQPEYKTSVQARTIEYEVYSKADLDQDLYKDILSFTKGYLPSLNQILSKDTSRILVLKNALNNKIIGISVFYKMDNTYFLDEFDNRSTTEYLRSQIKGNTIFIPYMYSPRNFNTLLNETLLYAIEDNFNYCILKFTQGLDNSFPIRSISSHGFLPIPGTENLSYLVDMSNPITFSENIEIFLKPPFHKDLVLKSVIEESRLKIKDAITSIFPGQLIVSISKDMLYSKMIEKICDFNKVDSLQKEKRILGQHICTPFGSILNDTIVPNTVTKTIHTEKVFSHNLDDFTIKHFPNYLSLENQIKVLNSFNRPVILVDDILHKGYRLESISPYLLHENLDIKCLIVGILSGRGLEIAKKYNLEIDSAYFIPNLKIWFNESSLIPFLGGDMVDIERDNQMLIPSINFILPYANPRFIRGNRDKIFNFSKVALENSIAIFEVIETIYQQQYMKSLLIRNLGEVLTIPRKPDSYNIVDYSASIKPSEYLRKDLNNLYRIY